MIARVVIVAMLTASLALAGTRNAAILLQVASFTATGAAEQPPIPTSSLVSWWRPGTSGSGEDIIGGHNLTANAGASLVSNGFRTTGDLNTTQAVWAAYTAAHYSTNFTVGLLVNVESISFVSNTVVTMVDRGAGSVVYGWTMEWVTSTNQVRFIVGGNATYVIATSTTGNSTTNQWVHYAGTYDGSTTRLYRNGIQVASASGSVTVSNAQQGITFSARHPTPGNLENNSVRSMNGRFDEMTYYGSALASNLVLQLATNLLAVKE